MNIHYLAALALSSLLALVFAMHETRQPRSHELVQPVQRTDRLLSILAEKVEYRLPPDPNRMDGIHNVKDVSLRVFQQILITARSYRVKTSSSTPAARREELRVGLRDELKRATGMANLELLAIDSRPSEQAWIDGQDNYYLIPIVQEGTDHHLVYSRVGVGRTRKNFTHMLGIVDVELP